MGDNLQDWLEKRNEERSETDLAFRPFIRWFDRNLETLFTSSATKVSLIATIFRYDLFIY